MTSYQNHQKLRSL